MVRTTDSCSTAAIIQARLLLHTGTSSCSSSTFESAAPRAGLGSPVDGHHGETAAAAAGERVWRHLLPSQGRQHTGLPPKEVRDQPHELKQGYGVIPAGNIRGAEVKRKFVCLGFFFFKSVSRWCQTHSAATKLHSEEERGM